MGSPLDARCSDRYSVVHFLFRIIIKISPICKCRGVTKGESCDVPLPVEGQAARFSADATDPCATGFTQWCSITLHDAHITFIWPYKIEQQNRF
jgi:hypothetical protein